MIVSNQASLLWKAVPDNALERIASVFDRHPGATVFFRADDVAIPSRKQDRLLATFIRRDAPLCPALIPAWLSAARWAEIDRQVGTRHDLFAWHQHGWNHLNHEVQGKKQEFGPNVSAEQKRQIIVRGRDKLQSIVGELLQPVFTPPWNRMGTDAMDVLMQEGFQAMSRYSSPKIKAPEGFPDFYCNVDLHTRKEQDPTAGWDALLDELDQALSTGRAGIMIHHQRMNDAAFVFLDRLLAMLRSRQDLRLVHFGHLLETGL